MPHAIRALSPLEIERLNKAAPLSFAAVPLGLSNASSLAPAKIEADAILPTQRPALSPPEANVMYHLLAIHQKIDALNALETGNFEEWTQSLIQEREKISAEKQEALRKEAEEAKSRGTWEILGQIAQYITSITSIILGAKLDNTAGKFLIASGVIGVGSRLLNDTGFLKAAVEWYTKSEELQKVITERIDMAFFLLQLGCGVVGGIGSFQHAVAGVNAATVSNVTEKAASIMGTASGLMTTGTHVGMKFHDKRISEHQAQVKRLNANMARTNHDLTEQNQTLTKMEDSVNLLVKELHKMVQSQQISLD